MSKIYATLCGIEYKGWDVYINGKDNKEFSVFDTQHDNEMNKLVSAVTYTPKLGDSIYVMPNCKLAAADIRKNYTIKRSPADASAIIVSDYGFHRDWDVIDSFYTVPERRAIFIDTIYHSWRCTKSFEEFAIGIMPELTTYYEQGKALKYKLKDNDRITFYYYPTTDLKGLIDVYEGTINKPLVPYKNLVIINDNQLDIETLQMFFNVGLVTRQPGCIENFKIQMQAMNQTNWRSYKGTLSMLYGILNKNRYCAANEVFNRPSCLPKAAKELYDVMSSENAFELRKDADLAREFLQTVVDFNPNDFTEINNIQNKFYKAKVDFEYFYRLYDNIVKIRSKCIGN